MDYLIKLNELGITLTHNGKQTCPKCSAERKNKTDKCLSVTYGDDGVLYKCHNCDWAGIVHYRDKNEYKKIYKRPQEPKQKTDKQHLHEYFSKRGISKDVVDRYKIGINQNKEIIFPYYKNGILANVKYRTNQGNGKKTFRQEAETEKTFYGMDEVKDDKQVVFVEGEIDVLSCAEYGIEAVSVPQGASEKKLECIENCWEWLQKFETFIIAVDNDSAGDKLKSNLLNRLDKDKCKIVDFKQYKDANEILMNNDNLLEFIVNAQPIAPDGVVFFKDNYDEIMDYFTNGETKGYSTGWDSLDDKFTIKTGNLMVVTGYPSRGKSFFVDNLLHNLSIKYDMRHLIASFENTTYRHLERFATMMHEKSRHKMTKQEIEQSISYYNEHMFLLSNSRMWNIDEICATTELMVRKYGIKTLTIDPYNRLKNDYKDREDKYIGSILSKLCMLSKKLDILIIFIAHPKKPDGEKMPNMYSISGSGDWYNMADYGIIVHRERNEQTHELYNRPQICVAKVKDFSLGNPSGGIVELTYRPDKYKIVEEEF